MTDAKSSHLVDTKRVNFYYLELYSKEIDQVLESTYVKGKKWNEH